MYRRNNQYHAAQAKALAAARWLRRTAEKRMARQQ
jgi:hypothetical protein